MEYFSKDEIIKGRRIRIKIWDTAGQEQYKSLTKNFFRNSNGILVAFDVTNRKTFEKIPEWMNVSKDNAETGIPIVILGNKIDLGQQVTNEEALKVANHYNVKFFETSAKSNIGISEAIIEIANQILLKQKPDEYKISLADSHTEEKESGCKC